MVPLLQNLFKINHSPSGTVPLLLDFLGKKPSSYRLGSVRPFELSWTAVGWVSISLWVGPLRARKPSSLWYSKDHRWQWGLGWYFPPPISMLLQVQPLPVGKRKGNWRISLNPRGIFYRYIYTHRNRCTHGFTCACANWSWYGCFYSESIIKSLL